MNRKSEKKVVREKRNRVDQDSPWKDLLDLLFAEFINFFFPDAYEQIDWSIKVEFYDKELQEINRKSKLGRRYVDKLAKVRLKTGESVWGLVHVEIQARKEEKFEERAFIYRYKIFERYHQRVATFIILTDSNRNWRPSEYKTELLGSEISFKFRTVKLIDYEDRIEELEKSSNPFAIAVLAILKSKQTEKRMDVRYAEKFNLMRMLCLKGYSRKEIEGLLSFLDWIMVLPEELEEKLQDKIIKMEGEAMPYVTSFERIGIKKGVQKGRKEGQRLLVMRLLSKKLGPVPDEIKSKLELLAIDKLEELGEALLDFHNLDDLKDWLSEK
jgi:hypothetical protein